MQRTLRYLFTGLCSLLLCLAGTAYAQTADSTTSTDTSHIVAQHQLCLGADVSAPIRNILEQGRTGYELAADYYLKNEIYLAAEGGWGSSAVDYTDLKYKSRNTFIRVGFNKMLFPRENAADWGGLLLGMRLGAASIHRDPATFTVIDSFWGSATGVKPSKDFGAYWAEVTAGVRVELVKGLFAGWNIRGKFMLNAKSFNDLAPLYIAGYGKGEKTAVFDINFYLSYGIRWQRKSMAAKGKSDAQSPTDTNRSLPK